MTATEPVGTEVAPAEGSSGAPRQVRSVVRAAISQGLSAASNFAIVLALGRAGGEATVGEYALAFVVYNSTLGLQRALVTDALLARPFRGEESRRGEDARAVTTSLLLSLAAALIVLVVGLVSPYRQLVALAPFLPLLLLQDLARYLLFRRGRPGTAACIDAVWALCSAGAFVALLAQPGSHRAIVLWGSGGALAAVTAVAVARLRPAPILRSLRWWRSELWSSSRWLTLESSLFHADQQLTAFGITAMAGRAAFGSWQITQSLLGVAAFLNLGVVVTVITHLSDGRGGRRTSILASAVTFGFVVLLTVTLVVVREPLLRVLYDGRVDLSISQILATGAFLAMGSAATGAISVLRAARAERTLPLARGLALLAFSPVAIIVSRHHFIAGLWLLAAGAATYFAVVARAAWGPARDGHADAIRGHLHA